MFKIDLTKKQLSQSINQHQRTLNYNNTQRHKLSQNTVFKQRKLTLPQNGNYFKNGLKKDLAGIQKQQIQLKKLNSANNLIKSRIEDQQNLLTNKQKFPYGKQNVDISQDVLQRYKSNFVEQSRILDKFKLQAELMKKISKSKKNGNTKQMENLKLRDYSDKHLKQLKKMRQTLQKQYDQQQLLRELEKQNVRNIANTLSGLSYQLYNNSYTLEKGIRELQNRLKRLQMLRIEDIKPKHTYKDIIDLQFHSKKIPIVVYNNKQLDARLYFSDVFRNTQKIVPTPPSMTDKTEYNGIVKILKQNGRRLAFLDKISQSQNLFLQ